MKLLKFTLRGDFGHFGVRYTTSSKATHFVPLRHTLAGILGAILGIQRDQLSTVFAPSVCKIGLEPVSHLRYFRFPLKQILLKSSSFSSSMNPAQRSIIPFQMLRNPEYVIYFNHYDERIQSKMKSMLENHECHYPPALGLAQLLADFEFIDEVDATPVNPYIGFQVKTRSVAPAQGFNVYPGATNHIAIERFAHHLDEARVSQRFHTVVLDVKGQVIEGQIEENFPEFVTLVMVNDQPDHYVFLW